MTVITECGIRNEIVIQSHTSGGRAVSDAVRAGGVGIALRLEGTTGATSANSVMSRNAGSGALDDISVKSDTLARRAVTIAGGASSADSISVERVGGT